MNRSIEPLNAVNGPHSQIGNDAYQTRVAIGEKIQSGFVDPCSVPAGGQQVRQRRQNASVIINHGHGSNRRRGHFFLRSSSPTTNWRWRQAQKVVVGDVSSCSLPACLTSVANESARIFLMMWP